MKFLLSALALATVSAYMPREGQMSMFGNGYCVQYENIMETDEYHKVILYAHSKFPKWTTQHNEESCAENGFKNNLAMKKYDGSNGGLTWSVWI